MDLQAGRSSFSLTWGSIRNRIGFGTTPKSYETLPRRRTNAPLCFNDLCFNDLCFNDLCFNDLCFNDLCFNDLCFNAPCLETKIVDELVCGIRDVCRPPRL